MTAPRGRCASDNASTVSNMRVFFMRPEVRQTAAYCMAFVALGMAISALGPAMLSLGRQVGVSNTTSVAIDPSTGECVDTSRSSSPRSSSSSESDVVIEKGRKDEDGLAEMGFVFVARSFGYLVGSVFGGPLFDCTNGNRVLAVCLSATSLGLFLIPFAKTLPLMVFLWSTSGISMGMLDTGANVSILWLFGDKSGPYMQALHFSFGLGAVVGPVVIGNVLRWTCGDTNWAFWAMGLFALPIVPWLFSFPPSARPSSHARPKLRWPEVGVVGASAFMLLAYVGAEVCAASFMPSYAVIRGFTDEPTAAMIAAVFWATLMLGRLVAIPLSTRMSSQNMLIIDLGGCIAATVLWWIGNASLNIMWVVAAIYGLFMASTFPTVITYAENLMELTGKLTTILVVGASLGEMLVPLTVAMRIAADPIWLIRVLFGCAVLGCVAFAFIMFIAGPRTDKSLAGKRGLVDWTQLPGLDDSTDSDSSSSNGIGVILNNNDDDNDDDSRSASS